MILFLRKRQENKRKLNEAHFIYSLSQLIFPFVLRHKGNNCLFKYADYFFFINKNIF